MKDTWKTKKYEVTYDLDNGTADPSIEYPVMAGYGEDYTLPPTNLITRDGYNFNTWDVNGVERGPDTDIKVNVTGPVTIKPKWKQNTIALTFVPNYPAGGVTGGSMNADMSYTFGSTAELPACTATVAGYNFKGWSQDSDGTEILTPGTDVGSTISASTTLYAIWDEKTKYSVTYNLGDRHIFKDQATSTKFVRTVYAGDDYVLPEKTDFTTSDGKEAFCFYVNGDTANPYNLQGTITNVNDDIVITVGWVTS